MNSPRILVVEDDDDIREVLVDWLKGEGYEVFSAASAERAYELLREQRPDVLMSDHVLPIGNGLELITRAIDRKLITAPRCLLVSGTPPREEAAARGVQVLQKPLDLDRLVAELERAVASTEVPSPVVATDHAMVLYVTAGSHASRRAERAARRLIEAHGGIRLDVRDVAAHPEQAAADRVTYTPMLVTTPPLPPLRLVGDLRDTRALRELLEDLKT